MGEGEADCSLTLTVSLILPACLVPPLAGVTKAASACFRCGRTTHWASDCTAVRDLRGRPIDDSD